MWKFQNLLWQTRSVLLSPLGRFFQMKNNKEYGLVVHCSDQLKKRSSIWNCYFSNILKDVCVSLFVLGCKSKFRLLSFCHHVPISGLRVVFVLAYCISSYMWIQRDHFCPFTSQGFKLTKQSHWSPKLCWQATSANRNPAAGRFLPNQQSLGIQLAQLGRDASAAVSRCHSILLNWSFTGM